MGIALIIELVILFLIKVFDNVIMTGKTILIQKGRGFLASLTVILSQVIFYKLITAVGDNDLQIWLVSIASGVGTYIAVGINEKFSKEKTYVNVILSDDKEEMIKLRDYLIENKITNLTTDGYTKEWEKTLAITAYVETKEQSKLLDKYIETSETKFKRVVTKE